MAGLEARASGARREIRAWAELFALAGFAIAQPILDVFGRAPDVFIARDASSADIVLFGLLLTLVPATALWIVEVLVGLAGRRPRRIVHLSFVGLLAALFVIQLFDEVDGWRRVATVAAALAAGVFTVLALVRWRVVREWLGFLAFAPVVFVALFLFASPVSDLIGGEPVEALEVEVGNSPRTIVMVVWDEWPAMSIVDGEGEIDADLYPNLAGLAEDGGWYRNATTVATATQYAVPALLTGRYPESGTTVIPVANQYPENLFTMLAGSHDLEVKESITRLCPTALCSDDFIDDPVARAEAEPDQGAKARGSLGSLLGDAVDTYRSMLSLGAGSDAAVPVEETSERPVETTTSSMPAPDAAVEEARGEEVSRTGPGGFVALPVLELDAVNELLSSIEIDEEPTVHFLHLQLPHTPYRFYPSGQAYEETAGRGPAGLDDVTGTRATDSAQVTLERQRLQLQVGYVDRVIGQITDRLEESGLYDDSIVVMTSDHGANFVPGESNRGLAAGPLAEDTYSDILYVPLIIKAPGIEAGTVTDANVMTIDVLPTIADLLGIDLSWQVDGRSVLESPRDSDRKRFHKMAIGAGGLTGGLTVEAEQTFDGAAVLSTMLARNVDTLFGENPGHRWFSITDAGALVGRPIDELDVESDSPSSVHLDDLGRFEDVSLDDPVLPGLLAGTADDADPETTTVAVALNGIVAAVADLSEEGDSRHFEMVLDPAAIEAGANEVAAFSVDGREGSWVLHALNLS